MNLEKLKAICVGATAGAWEYMPERYSAKCVIKAPSPDDRWIAHCQPELNGECNGRFIATFNPALVLAMLEVIQAGEAIRTAHLDEARAILAPKPSEVDRERVLRIVNTAKSLRAHEYFSDEKALTETVTKAFAEIRNETAETMEKLHGQQEHRCYIEGIAKGRAEAQSPKVEESDRTGDSYDGFLKWINQRAAMFGEPLMDTKEGRWLAFEAGIKWHQRIVRKAEAQSPKVEENDEARASLAMELDRCFHGVHGEDCFECFPSESQPKPVVSKFDIFAAYDKLEPAGHPLTASVIDAINWAFDYLASRTPVNLPSQSERMEILGQVHQTTPPEEYERVRANWAIYHWLRARIEGKK